MIYEIDLDKLPRKPGVYIFIRKFGENSRALYIGKANRLRTRIKQQLVALRLMKGIQNAAIGPRAESSPSLFRSQVSKLTFACR
jgi:hypothetical protein